MTSMNPPCSKNLNFIEYFVDLTKYLQPNSPKHNLIINSLRMYLDRYTHSTIPVPCKFHVMSHGQCYLGKDNSYILFNTCLVFW